MKERKRRMEKRELEKIQVLRGEGNLEKSGKEREEDEVEEEEDEDEMMKMMKMMMIMVMLRLK